MGSIRRYVKLDCKRHKMTNMQNIGTQFIRAGSGSQKNKECYDISSDEIKPLNLEYYDKSVLLAAACCSSSAASYCVLMRVFPGV